MPGLPPREPEPGVPAGVQQRDLITAVPELEHILQAHARGTPLVLLTRFRGTLDTWDPLFLDRLARTHRVITVDYPGVGYSGGPLPADIGSVAAFVKAFATKIGVTRFAVLGWSWGGLVAQIVLLEYPEAVSHAVLVGTAPPGASSPRRTAITRVRSRRTSSTGSLRPRRRISAGLAT